MTLKELFPKFSAKASELVGSAGAFCGAVGLIVLWAICGPATHYSENWQLVINTGTTIITFLMVFLIQNTQNRDSKMIHIKLDELIRSHKDARNHLIDLHDIPEEELERLAAEFTKLRQKEASLQETLESVEEKLTAVAQGENA